MEFSTTGQEKCDLLIQVTARVGLTVYYFMIPHFLLFQHAYQN